MPKKSSEPIEVVKKKQRLCDAYREVFDNPKNLAGKLVMRDLENKFFFTKPANTLVAGDPQATGFQLGQWSVLVHIAKQVTFDMEKIYKIMREQGEENE